MQGCSFWCVCVWGGGGGGGGEGRSLQSFCCWWWWFAISLCGAAFSKTLLIGNVFHLRHTVLGTLGMVERGGGGGDGYIHKFCSKWILN